MDKKYVIAGNLINGVDSTPKQNIGILIEGSIIRRIDEPFETPQDCEVLDFREQTVMPGMINAHVHLAYDTTASGNGDIKSLDQIIDSLWELDEYLRSGVTYIRVCGASTYLDTQLRNALYKGTIKGPGIKAAGRGITMTGGAGHRFEIEADGVDECRKAARTVIKLGADFIKTVATGSMGTKGIVPGATQFSKEELAVIVEEAHKAGKKVAVHAHGGEGIHNAALAGVDSIEHSSYLMDRTIQIMLDKGIYMVPTLTTIHLLNEQLKDGSLDPEMSQKAGDIFDANKASFSKALKAGVKIASGTDVGTDDNPPSKTWMEPYLMAEYGMDKMEALQTITRNAADLLGILEDFGTIEEGKQADLVILEHNPLEDMTALNKVRLVIKGGDIYQSNPWIVY